MHHGNVPFGKIVVPHVGKENQKKKQGTRPDPSNRPLDTLGSCMSEGAKKRGSNPGTAKMSMERSKGGSDSSLKIAQCHRCVPIDEARRGQAGSK